jgi:hypothetical protein
MSRYIARTCPRCREYFGVMISYPSANSQELPIIGWCAVCGYALDGWRLIVNRQPSAGVRYGRMRKAFKL